ncbi:hypothetical protein [Xanthocytophaga agilis]|uniref:Transcription elongation factor n=1 Tax=Xanthocytophaga agilis TaxID=3048010 RepID=A0AAE3UC82_9BACT|nr:hypothetical protein [Xanthocytophaga agilis]MDJ1499066.1 hypothetical protein [Xanthocytophaga agilis]
MELTEYKKQIIQSCRKALEASEQVAQQTIDQRITDATESDEEGWSDKYESKDEEMIEDSRQLEPHMDFLRQELVQLDSINEVGINAEVGKGAVVITDSIHFFIGVSIPFKVNGEDFMAISTNAPIYSVMKGKKEGDTFSFNGKNYKIKQLF